MDDGLIERIYDAALDGGLWPEALSQIAVALDAVSAGLWVPAQQQAGVVISRGSEEAASAYANYWYQHDVIGAVVLKAKRPGLFCDWQTLSASTRASHPFYQDFQRPFGFRDNISFTSDLLNGLLLGMSLQYPIMNSEPPDASVVSRFGNIGRHVGRAILFLQRVAPEVKLSEARRDALSDLVSGLMATLSCGIACLDTTGRVILANAVFENFARDGLAIVKSRLVTASTADQSGLDALLRRALACDPFAGEALAQVSRPSGRNALLVSVLPISAPRQATYLAGASSCRAVVTVVDPDAGAGAKVEPALCSLGLSPAEARLAALVGSGLSPREAAERLGITEGTARTRLKQVFEKLGISRQSELARLVTQLALTRPLPI